MREVFLVDGARTPQGRYGGALAEVRPDDMAALVAGLPDSLTGFTVNQLCASGSTAVATAAAMIREGARRGLATLCVGVGQGVAMLVEVP
ncbi:hypothetical protein ACIRRA_37190 [Nocardia sp. NPDC101769]|uniref:thiolase family protein n=1 Tax=Nocardia sp. NPDC101769 TaxID=3364333 RepID=UPI0037FA2CFE